MRGRLREWEWQQWEQQWERQLRERQRRHGHSRSTWQHALRSPACEHSLLHRVPSLSHRAVSALPLPPPLLLPQFNDDQLKWSRLDFVKLADMEQVQAFVKTGYAYAERTDAGSEWAAQLAAGSWLACAYGEVGRHGEVIPRQPVIESAHPAHAPAHPPCPSACPPAGDCFERALGEVRKGAMRQLLEVPVWGLRRALASVDS